MALTVGVCAAAGTPDAKRTSLCASRVPSAPPCLVSRKDLKEAKTAFARGMKLRDSKHLDEALGQFEKASSLVPQDIEFATARELIRQQLVYDHMQRGNTALLNGNEVEALAEFRSAFELDPQNQFAQQRMNDALGEPGPHFSAPPQILTGSAEVRVAPKAGTASFRYRGDSRALLTEVTHAFGITAMFDDSVASRYVRYDIDSVDFHTAVEQAARVTKTFWTPLDESQILFAADTAENHKQFDRMAARTFYIPSTDSPQELNDVVNALRTVFEIRFIAQKPAANTLTLRAPQRILDAATAFLENLDAARPQVMLDIKLYQISRSLVHNLGLQIPNQFQMFNIPASALAVLGGQNIQDLINQLIASGGINQANSTAISALLAQLQSQQNSIFSQPLATFGGGKTLMGIRLGTAGARLSLNQSEAKSLEHATLIAAQGKDTTFRAGSRYPILNASFAPIFNTPAISRVIGNNSFVPAFPSFNYEELGLTIKAKPQIHGNSDVRLELEIAIRSLGGTSLNGVPVINNREYKGAINVKEGEPAVIAGAITHTELRSMNGIPGLGNVPLLNRIMTTNSKENDEDEVLVVVTPHIVSGANSGAGAEPWLSMN